MKHYLSKGIHIIKKKYVVTINRVIIGSSRQYCHIRTINKLIRKHKLFNEWIRCN